MEFDLAESQGGFLGGCYVWLCNLSKKRVLMRYKGPSGMSFSGSSRKS